MGRERGVKDKKTFQILDVDLHYTLAIKVKQLHNVLNTYFQGCTLMLQTTMETVKTLTLTQSKYNTKFFQMWLNLPYIRLAESFWILLFETIMIHVGDFVCALYTLDKLHRVTFLFHCPENLTIDGNHLWDMTHRHYVNQCNYKLTQFEYYGAWRKQKTKKKNEILFLKELIIFYFGNKKRNTAKVAVEYYRV